MTKTFRCGDDSALLAYLYQEGEADEREAVAAHLTGCERCAGELGTLAGARQVLASWQVPETPLGFRVGPEDADTVVDARSAFAIRGGGGPSGHPEARVPWWHRPLPAWAQAAAAAVLFAGGLALGGAFGSTQHVPVPVPVVAVEAPVDEVRQTLAALESRLNELEAQADEARTRLAALPAAALDEAAVMRAIRTEVTASEARQTRQLALRQFALMQDVDNMRRIDSEQQRELFYRLVSSTMSDSPRVPGPGETIR